MKLKFIFLASVCVFMISFLAKGQEVDLYTHSEIPEIYITIPVDSLEELYLEENWYENHEYQCLFVFQTQLSTDTIENVGIRFRGNTSRDKIKKSFKFSFNTYEPGRKYGGVEKMNVNAETNDPSMVRSYSTWDLYGQMGVAAPRSNHVALYINGDFFGLYQNAEHIDEEFADDRFGSKMGNLYKCSYPGNLDYISNNPEDYKVATWGDRTYDLKTNMELDDYSDIAEFIGFLNQASEIDYQCDFNQYFNVYAYLKTVAVDVLTGNWDGYIYNQNNYYLFHNPITTQFEYIPYDVDNTWGIDWLDRNWSNRNIYTWSQTGEPRPLYNRLMNNDVYRDIFTWHIQNMLDNFYGTSAHQAAIENVHGFIADYALADTYRPLDFGFSDSDFLNALGVAVGGHVDYGVVEFKDIRKSQAANQVEDVEIAPIIFKMEEDMSALPDFLTIRVFVEGPEAAAAEMNYSWNNVEQPTITISETESIYTFQLPVEAFPQFLTYNISVEGSDGLSRQAFCESRNLVFGQQGIGIVINEVMSANSTTIQDQEGEYDDWIEIYNAGAVTFGLQGYYFSDNSLSQKKWSLPDDAISSGSHKMFWSDRDLWQGSNHTNFKISSSGERIYLFKKITNGVQLVDYIDVPGLTDDESYGRVSDAASDWVVFNEPTPNASNGEPMSIDDFDTSEMDPYPNPTKGLLHWDKRAAYTISDLSGRVLMQQTGKRADLSVLPEGVYILSLGTRKFKVVRSN